MVKMQPTLPTIEEEVRLSGRQLWWRYRLQFQAMASACMVYVAGGMKLAWSVYEPPAGKFLSSSSTHQLTVAWFLGVALGCIIAATFVQRVTKNVAHCSSGALLLFGGILFICLPTHFSALAAGCLCEGCAYGLTQVQALVTGAEVAHKQLRGLLLSGERIFLWLGICLQLLYARLWYALEPATGHVWHLDQLHGIVVGCLGLAAIALAWLHRFESPLLLQRQQRDYAAEHTLQRLLHARYPTQQEVASMREDYKQLLAYDAALSPCRAFAQCNALSLLKLVCIRCFAALSLTLPFNRTFLTASSHGFGCGMNCIYALAACGLLGSVIGGLLVDRNGRRRLSVISLLLAGIFVFIVGGIFRQLQTTQQVLCSLNFEMAACLLLLYQLVVCAGVGVASTVYAAEAFTLRVKAPCLAALLVCEQLLHIGLAGIAFNVYINNAAFFFGIGTLCLLLGLFIFLCMPETKELSLSDCLRKFGRAHRI